MATYIEGTNFSDWKDTCVLYGMLVQAPTTASTQGSGAVKPTVRFNREAGAVSVSGNTTTCPALINQAIGAGALPILAVGESVVLTVTAYRNPSSGVWSLARIETGVKATTGSEIALSDAEINTVEEYVGKPWVRIADITINRTGDTTLTQSVNNDSRNSIYNDTALATRAVALESWKNNRVVSGMLIKDGTSPASSQASGAVAPVVKANRTSGQLIVNGMPFSIVSDAVSGAVSDPPVLGVGQSAKAVFVGVSMPAFQLSAGTWIWGTPATSGQEVVPTPAEIRAALATNPNYDSSTFVRVNSLTIARTGDTTITFTADNNWRDF